MKYEEAARETFVILCAAVVLGFSYTAFAGKGFFGKPSSGDTTRVAAKGPGPVPITLAEAKSMFDAGSAVFVDSRHFFDFRRGHIKSAISIPLNEFETKHEAVDSLPKDKAIIVYCDASECNSSIELAAKLYENGFGGIRIFFGGWQEWTTNKFPTETSPR